MNNNNESGHPNRPWSVDRWGRLLSGSGILLLTALGILHRPAWLIGTLFFSVGMVFTALTDRCAVHDMLMRLGAKEREDLFLPGGKVRPEIAMQSKDSRFWSNAAVNRPSASIRR